MVGQSVTAAAALPTLSFKSRHGNNRTLGTYLMTNHTPTLHTTRHVPPGLHPFHLLIMISHGAIILGSAQ